jgi:hypothetical protein
MLIIVDNKIPDTARARLSEFGEVIGLSTSGITYDAISGHPDIFFCQHPGGIIVAPNLPAEYFEILDKHNIPYIIGINPVGKIYPESAVYNAVVTDTYYMHYPEITDPAIKKIAGNQIPITVRQGYCRCSLLPLRDHHFITSDIGIHKILTDQKLDALYVSPKAIILEDFPHGFFGGACGVYGNRIFICGSLNCFPDGEKVKIYLRKLDYEIIELCDDRLTDVGSILFVQ